MEIAAVLLQLPFAYLIGSISSGYLVGRLYRGVDLRQMGSGSTGATNTLRTLGKGAALLVAVLDILKGMIAVAVATAVVAAPDLRPYAQACAVVGAIAGHCWPVFLAGRGGRGVATGFGALLFIASPASLFAIAAFALAIALTRMVSVGSLAAATSAVIGYAFFSAFGIIAFHWAVLLALVASAAIIIWRHRPNILRILRGAEPRLGQAT